MNLSLFLQYLMSYIKQSCSDSIVGKYALQCHKHLTKTRATSRKNPPSMSEIMVSSKSGSHAVTTNKYLCKVHHLNSIVCLWSVFGRLMHWIIHFLPLVYAQVR